MRLSNLSTLRIQHKFEKKNRSPKMSRFGHILTHCCCSHCWPQGWDFVFKRVIMLFMYVCPDIPFLGLHTDWCVMESFML